MGFGLEECELAMKITKGNKNAALDFLTAAGCDLAALRSLAGGVDDA